MSDMSCMVQNGLDGILLVGNGTGFWKIQCKASKHQ